MNVKYIINVIRSTNTLHVYCKNVVGSSMKISRKFYTDSSRLPKKICGVNTSRDFRH